MINEPPSKTWIVIIVAIIGATGVIMSAIIGLGLPFAERLADRYYPPFTPIASLAPTSAFIEQTPQVNISQPNNLPQPPVVNEPIVVSVSATKGWQGSGIIMNIGDSLKIRYKEGSWLSVKDATFFGPDPTFEYETLDKCFPLPTAPGALIGMIGNYDPFKVGYGYETISNVSGELFFRMNDCDQWLFDNKDELEGGIRVIVNVISNP